jgi:hypothetical protein
VTTIVSAKPRKGYKGLPMEGFVARWYARNTAGRDHRKSAEFARLLLD